MFAYDTVYNDTDIAQIESLPPDALHRNVDVTIVEADQAGYLKSYIILPSTVWGIASGKLIDIGVQNPHSVQIPYMIKYFIRRGHAGLVGEGKNIVSA